MGDSRRGMAEMGARRVRASCCIVVLFAMGITANMPEGLSYDSNDGMLDDLSVQQLQDPGTDGELFHGDSNHMSKEDLQKAGKVFDTLFPAEGDDSDSELGEGLGAEMQDTALKSLSNARAKRKQATKALLKAKSVAGTKAAQKALKAAKKQVAQAKLKVVGKQGVTKMKAKVAANKLRKDKKKEKLARKQILKATGLKATLKAEQKYRKDNGKGEASSEGVIEQKDWSEQQGLCSEGEEESVAPREEESCRREGAGESRHCNARFPSEDRDIREKRWQGTDHSQGYSWSIR